MRATIDSAILHVELVDARCEPPLRLCLKLPAGSCVDDALHLAGLSLPLAGLGIHGRRCEPGELLAEGDRVELYRPLHADARARRRERIGKRRGS